MRTTLTLITATLLTLPTILLAQTAPAPQADQPPPPPQRGNFNAPDMLTGIQKEIRATDEEWKVIAPQLRKVINARRTVESATTPQMGNFFGGRGGGGGGGGGRRQDSFNGPGGGPRGGGGPGGPPGIAGPGGGPPNDTRPSPMTDRQPAGGPPNDRPDNNRPNRPAPDAPQGQTGPGGPPNAPGNQGNFRPRGPGGGGPGMANNPVTLALSDLQSALADEKTTKEQLAEKVAAVRAARQKAKTALTQAESELRGLITPDQETILISQGLLE